MRRPRRFDQTGTPPRLRGGAFVHFPPAESGQKGRRGAITPRAKCPPEPPVRPHRGWFLLHPSPASAAGLRFALRGTKRNNKKGPLWPFFYGMFFPGHAPGKNTVTRLFSRRKTAKPARRPELNCREKPSEAKRSGFSTVSRPLSRSLRCAVFALRGLIFRLCFRPEDPGSG